jgi:serine/threonine-protein kinase HipA
MPGRSPLGVWLYGTCIGDLTEPRRDRMRFEFTEEAESRFRAGSLVFSAALPIDTLRKPNGLAVRAFFHELLPEGEARDAIEKKFMIARGDDFGLLEAIGRDCAGAVVILPLDITPDESSGSIEFLTEDQLARELRDLPHSPLGADEKVRVSLPGLQPKLLLARGLQGDGRWGRPVNGHPSTHILKPQDMQLPHYAAAEAFCISLARRLELTTIGAGVDEIEGIPVLIVSRYDRRYVSEGGLIRIERIHQEDMAQALSIDMLSGGSKYEADGGRSLRDVARLLIRSAGPADVRKLLRLMTLNVVCGNSDCHAKNISLLHPEDGSTALAPAYDITPTTFYRQVPTSRGPRDLSDELGMFINGKRSVHRITLNDLIAEGISWGLVSRDAEDAVGGVIDQLKTEIRRAAELALAPEELSDFVKLRRDALVAGHEASAAERVTSLTLGSSDA